METDKETGQPQMEKKAPQKGVRQILLEGVFFRILVIEAILLIWSVLYRFYSEDVPITDLLWYTLRILVLVVVILAFMMITLRRFLDRKIITPLESIARANRKMKAGKAAIEPVTISPDSPREIQGIVSSRQEMLDAVLKVSGERLKLVNFIKETFGRYVSKKIVDQILASPEGRKIGGRRATVTVLMSDLRGFSGLSDSRDPEEMVTILNRYLSAMTHVIQRYDGVIDEFIGDAVLAVFGIPRERESDPGRAVACALAMQNRLAELNMVFAKEGFPSLEMGIGINTGPVVVGNIGSTERTKYGIVGSAVNIASRIESNTIGGQVLVGETTYDEISHMASTQTPLTVMMKGLRQPIVCYPITEMGDPYNEKFRRSDTVKQAELSLPFRCWIIEEKKIISRHIDGETLLMGDNIFTVRLDRHLESLTNLKLVFTFCRDAHCFHDMYGKIVSVEKSGENTVYGLHMTFMEEDDKKILHKWRSDASPY